ncbi:hypothetical protein KM043_015685 [Ampulex compressa]|nr:hypothetical protein KM043_015685 [Ampulex compressa]
MSHRRTEAIAARLQAAETAPRAPCPSGNGSGDAGGGIRPAPRAVRPTETAADATGRPEWSDAPDSERISATGDAEPTWSQVVRTRPRRNRAPRTDTGEPEPVPSRPDARGARKPTRRMAPARNGGSGADRARSNPITLRGAERGEPRSRPSNAAAIRRPPKTAAVLITRVKEGPTYPELLTLARASIDVEKKQCGIYMALCVR